MNSAETHVPYNRGNVSEMKHHFLPMHILPFFMNPSLQVHTKEPKVFAQVECSGHDPIMSHSSTSDGGKVVFIRQIRTSSQVILTNAHSAILHESFIAGAYKRAKGVCTSGVFRTGSTDLTFIHICSEKITEDSDFNQQP